MGAQDAQESRSAAFEFLVAATHDAIFGVDVDGAITIWNPAAERLTEVRAADAFGEPVVEHLCLAAPTLMSELLERVLAGETIERMRTVVVAAGRSTPASLSMAPTVDVQGHPIGASGVVRDLSEEVETQEILAEVQTRMNQTQRLAHIGLWAWDLATDEVQWSEQLYDIAGVSPDEFAGDLASHLAVVGPDHRAMVETAMRDAGAEGSTFDVEYELVRPDGERRWVHQTGDPAFHPDRTLSELRGICQDLTERQRAVDALREADQLKDEFLGTVSHELRTPLTSIVGFGDLISSKTDGDISEYVDIIVRNGREMHDMVERILDFSRVQSGRLVLAPEPHRIEDLVDEAWPLVVSLLADHTVERSIEDDVTAIVDVGAFRRIFVNLVSNASKFSSAGSRIFIDASRSGSCCRMAIRDEGPGIPAEEIESVFERFHQVPSTMVAEKRGAGVGLSIVKSYTELLGGRVWAESDGRGTTVVVEFPG